MKLNMVERGGCATIIAVETAAVETATDTT